MKNIKTLMTITSCMLLLLAVASTTVSASTSVDHISSNVGRIGMASSASNRMLSTRYTCDNGGCIGMASSSGLI